MEGLVRIQPPVLFIKKLQWVCPNGDRVKTMTFSVLYFSEKCKEYRKGIEKGKRRL
jgi:hypothetical protein